MINKKEVEKITIAEEAPEIKIIDTLEERTERRKEDIIAKSLLLLKEGIDMGKLKITREHWYD